MQVLGGWAGLARGQAGCARAEYQRAAPHPRPTSRAARSSGGLPTENLDRQPSNSTGNGEDYKLRASPLRSLTTSGSVGPDSLRGVFAGQRIVDVQLCAGVWVAGVKRVEDRTEGTAQVGDGGARA